jgi:dienelactone hydrolase
MRELFRAEAQRLRWIAALYAVAHLGVLVFLTRMVDLLQQPALVYQVGAAIHMVAGIALGAWQLRTYRRPSAWLYLLHRPLAPWRIAAAVLGAGVAAAGLAVVVPMALTLATQRGLTARVVDARHLGLPLAGGLLVTAGYLTGALLAIAPLRRAPAPLALLGWLAATQASGVAALVVQLAGVAWLAALAVLAFRPVVDEVPRSPVGVAILALPLGAAMAVALPAVANMVFQFGWIVAGSHPLNHTPPPPGGHVEVSRDHPRDVLLRGLAGLGGDEAAVLRGQVELSDAVTLAPAFDALPRRHELTNSEPPEFDDDDGTRWVFSHDRMRFVGTDVAGLERRGRLAGNDGFAAPPIMVYGTIFEGGTLRELDRASDRLVVRIALPAGEVLTGPPERLGRALIALSNRAVIAFDARGRERATAPLAVLERVELPAPIGSIERVDVIELLDGYLVSIASGRDSPDGRALGQHWLVRVERGAARVLSQRALIADFPELFSTRTRWSAPVLDALRRRAVELGSDPDPLADAPDQPMGTAALVLAALLAAAATLWTALRVRRIGGSHAWTLAALVLGWPIALAYALIAPAPRNRSPRAMARLLSIGAAVAPLAIVAVARPEAVLPIAQRAAPAPAASVELAGPAHAAHDARAATAGTASADRDLAASPARDPALAAELAVERARPPAPALSREAFLVRPPVLAMALAPDGENLAWLQEERDGIDVWRMPASGGPPALLLRRGDAAELAWSSDGRWLFLVNAQRVVALAAAGQPGSGAIARLGGPQQRRFAGVDPVRAAAVWLREDGAGWRAIGPGVDEVLVRDTRPVLDVSVDGTGAPALARVADVDHQSIVRVRDGKELVRCPLATRCTLLSRAGERGSYLLSDLGGDHRRLQRVDDDGRHDEPASERSDRSAAHPDRGDLDELAIDPGTGRPLVARFGEKLVAVEPALAAPVAALARRLPRRGLRVALSPARWLVRERASTLRGERYHLFEPETGALRPIALPAWPRPDEAALARKLPVRWQASDGRTLHGYVSVPPGRDPRSAPLVVKPHGGPWAHTDDGYDAITQLLVNRGCAVFEPNYRGSTGLGRDYLLAARGDFGNGRVQRDIVEGARWVLAHGIGDPARVAALGGSFGGYAALLGATHEPALFRTAVASVAPPDFGWALADIARDGEPWQDSGVSLARTLRALELDLDDPARRDRLHRESPGATAAALSRPVLLLAGGLDDRVAVRSVIHYAARLRALGKDVSLFLDGDAGHALDDRGLREAALYLIERMLHRTVGASAPAPASTALGELVRTRTRLAGPALGAP